MKRLKKPVASTEEVEKDGKPTSEKNERGEDPNLRFRRTINPNDHEYECGHEYNYMYECDIDGDAIKKRKSAREVVREE